MLGRILVTFGGLLVVALFVALLAPLFVDWTNFRRDFEDQASQLLGKKVVVHGSVSARLLPFPSVTMEDVTVGTDVDGTPLVRVSRFSLDAELAPFLSGEARIFDMRIEEPKARIRLLPDGTLDWLRGSRPSIPARTVVLEKVSVTGGTVEFIDEQSGRNRVLTELDAALSARTLAGPWSVQGRAVLDGEAGQFGLTTSEFSSVSLPLRLRIDPEAR
ncbi:MAG: AsmA family protein, partial [Allorhizobium sp.]